MKIEESTAQGKLGARIKLARVNAGLTQDELARRLHIAPQSVGGWERGETSPRGHRLTKLAQLLEVDPTWLLLGPSETVYPPQRIATPHPAARLQPAPEPLPVSKGSNLLDEVQRECKERGLRMMYHTLVQASLDPTVDLLHPLFAGQVTPVDADNWQCQARSKLWALMLLARMEDLVDLHRRRVLFLCGPSSDDALRLAAEGKLLGNEVLIVPDTQSLCDRLMEMAKG